MTISGPVFTADVPMKARRVIGRNHIENGDFEFFPPTGVPTTGGTQGGYVSGSATNDGIDLLGLRQGNSGSWACFFDPSVTHAGRASMKISTTGTGSYVQLRSNKTSGYTTPIGQGFDMLSNTHYLLSYWMKTNYISGDAPGANIAMLEAKGDGSNNGSNLNTPQVKVTTG